MINPNTTGRFLQFIMARPMLRFLFHFIVWEFLYMLTGLPVSLSSPTPDWEQFFFIYGLLGTINFLLFYIMAFYVIPKLFIQQKKISLLVLICIVAAILFTVLKYETEYEYFNIKLEQVKALIMQEKKSYPALPIGPLTFLSYFGIYIWFSFIIIIIAFAYQLILVWYKNEKVRKELENQKLQAELSFLKMQINPHFLFNALNNIYSMAVLEKSKRTGSNIMKLSELIRYMLYEKEDEQYRVSLDKEINHINSFIDLQKLRHDGDTYIQFSIEGYTVDKKVPPLLLFPLIENSFKHGILQDAKKPVVIQLNITDHQLSFSIFNYKNNYLKDHTGGIGLANVRKRLALLYPDKHVITITETDQDFFVELQLPL